MAKQTRKLDRPREIVEVLVETTEDDQILVYLRDANTLIWSLPLKFPKNPQ